MTYVLLGGIALAALLVLYRLFGKSDLRRVARALRWIVGGGAALLAAFMLIRGRIDIASIVGAAAFSILRFGRIGPLVFDAGMTSGTNQSEVTSRYIAMTLAHGSGEVIGKVIDGAFKGADLIDLGETDTRQLLAEVAADPDSLALLETWLDKNRAGWREYFAAQDRGQDQSEDAPPSADLDQQAYDVLGLKPGATDAEIRVAHRNLMKGVHPDQGGSNYLASKINEAKDRLLKRRR